MRAAARSERALERTVEAVVLRWEAVSEIRDGGTNRRARRAVRRRLAGLSAVGVDVIVVTEAAAEVVDAAVGTPSGPGRRRIWPCRSGAPLECTPDGPVPWRPPIEGEPSPTVPVAAADAVTGGGVAEAVAATLADAALRGVGPGLVLLVLASGADCPMLLPGTERCPAVVVGDPGRLPPRVRRLSGGHGAALAVLDEQIARRRLRRVPTLDDDPDWTVREDDASAVRRRVADALLCLSSGGVTTRGSLEEDAGAGPRVLASGHYRGSGPDEALLPLPWWTTLDIAPSPASSTRILDLRTGVLLREERDALPEAQPPLRTMRLASAARPGVVALRAEAARGRLRTGAPLHPAPDEPVYTGGAGDRRWARTRPGGDDAHPADVVAAARQWAGRPPGLSVVDRVACYVTTPMHPSLGEALSRLDAASEVGFDGLLREQRAAWARRWDTVDIRIPADPEAQRALRFVLFQLWGLIAGSGHDELAIGARGATGPGYRGHVFWDADVFVLPALASIDPAASRAMVRYRIARLPAARRHARRSGLPGARYPWESAASGEDVTPTTGSLGGRVVSIRTGEREEHITADVAWAAAHHAGWCAEPQFLLGPARGVLLETAHYWASRCRLDDRGAVHLDGVIGPDEYHEDIDDNAYTNVMTRWHLRAAADLADRLEPGGTEARTWRRLADGLVDGLDPATGRHEQFAGYDRLESLEVTAVAAPPVAADILLGRDHVAATQLIKQPDVLMLHHLVPKEAGPDSLGPDVAFYAPRTTHGSSLSPGITAAVLARAGRTDEALQMLRLTLALDPEDVAGTTGAGLHVAALGAAWQAVLTGFAGVHVERGTLVVDPRPPAAWPSLEIRFRCLGRRLRLEIDHHGTTVRTDLPLRVRLYDRPPVWVHDAARGTPTTRRYACPKF